ncbi:MAG: energy transducer TonB [Acidobacteriota bacterium]|nr:energy transducer TonB [Acidobacteriota bacterium]
MLKQISILFILILFAVSTFAQTEKSTAHVKWERYKVSEKDVSILLPKLPVVIKSFDRCNELETANYAVYAEEAVYQFSITSKSNEKIPSFCTEKNHFSQKNYEDRLAELKISLADTEEIKLTINEKQVAKISGKSVTYWIFNDMKNNKWVELSTTQREGVTSHEEKFINSVNFGKSQNGIEIGNGALKTLGDEIKTDENKVEETSKQNFSTDKTEPMVIAFKPRANYTDMARQSQTQGSVMLRVTFLASGGIGSVSVVKGLPYGLIEQAIAAANKIVFIPQKVKGINITVTKQVQYNFTIY